MSWDVMVFRFAGKPPASTEEMDDAQRLPLGAAADVRAGIAAALPQTSWDDPTWGIFDGDGFSIEFNVGDDDPIDNMMLHVRGGGNAIAAIMSFVSPLGWSALDCSTGEFLDPAAPSEEGWKGFQAYRDKVIGSSDAGEE
jgi:hypothetical protein